MTKNSDFNPPLHLSEAKNFFKNCPFNLLSFIGLVNSIEEIDILPNTVSGLKYEAESEYRLQTRSDVS